MSDRNKASAGTSRADQPFSQAVPICNMRKETELSQIAVPAWLY